MFSINFSNEIFIDILMSFDFVIDNEDNITKMHYD